MAYFWTGLVCLIVGILGGGYGGYAWGRSVEAKAQAVLGAVKSGAAAVGTAVKQ